jgi:hypothetical protein
MIKEYEQHRKECKMEREFVKIVIDEDTINKGWLCEIIDPLWWTVSIYDGEEQYLKDLEKFTVPQRYVFAIEWYLAEVGNGGHDQFYFNSTGIVWEDAMKAFEVMGLKENYDLIKESARRMSGYPSKDRYERQKQLDEYEPDFGDLDDKLYKLQAETEAGVLEYVKNYKSDFFFEGMIEKPII